MGQSTTTPILRFTLAATIVPTQRGPPAAPLHNFAQSIARHHGNGASNVIVIAWGGGTGLKVHTYTVRNGMGRRKATHGPPSLPHVS